MYYCNPIYTVYICTVYISISTVCVYIRTCVYIYNKWCISKYPWSTLFYIFSHTVVGQTHLKVLYNWQNPGEHEMKHSSLNSQEPVLSLLPVPSAVCWIIQYSTVFITHSSWLHLQGNGSRSEYIYIQEGGEKGKS